MEAWTTLLASIRLFVIISLSFGNFCSLWMVISHPKKPASRQINRLVVICILIVNLVYIAFVWVPFSIGSFNYSFRNRDEALRFPSSEVRDERILFEENKELPESLPIHQLKQYATASEEVPHSVAEVASLESFKNSSDDIHSRVVRQATVESEIHEGTWAIVFPVNSVNGAEPSEEDLLYAHDNIDSKAFPFFIDIDCGFQDTVTSSCCYCLAFVAIIKLILTTKPLSLPSSCLAHAGYAAILTGVPFLATLAIRYAEQVGSKFAPHTPKLSSSGYTVYNIICDVHISDSFVFLSFLEWAGLMMVLLLTVTSFLGVATKTNKSHGYSNELNDRTTYKVSEKVVFVGGKWTRDIVLCLGALWSWPLKPSTILAFYVIYGQHWTNIASWISHLVIAVSVVFIPLAVFLTSHTFLDEEDNWNVLEESEENDSKPNIHSDESLFHTKLTRSSLPEVFNHVNLSNPTYEENYGCGKYARQINDKEAEISDSISIVAPSKCAEEIRNNIKEHHSDSTNYKFIITIPESNAKESDKKLILQHDELDQPTTSDV